MHVSHTTWGTETWSVHPASEIGVGALPFDSVDAIGWFELFPPHEYVVDGC